MRPRKERFLQLAPEGAFPRIQCTSCMAHICVVEYMTDVVGRKAGMRQTYGKPKIIEARIADHGDAVDSRHILNPRNPGSISREKQARLYDRSDHNLSIGSEKCRPP